MTTRQINRSANAAFRGDGNSGTWWDQPRSTREYYLGWAKKYPVYGEAFIAARTDASKRAINGFS